MRCLMIIDVQQGFINEHTRHLPEKIERLQQGYDQIFATQFINHPDSPHARILHWHRFMPGGDEVRLAFQVVNNVHVIRKSGYGAIGSKVMNVIQKYKIQQIDLCGMDTDMCVLKNAVDLFEAGIVPRVLTEYCGSHAGPEFHEMGLRLLERAIGKEQLV